MYEPSVAGDRPPDVDSGRFRVPTLPAGRAVVPAGRSTVQVAGRPVGLLYVPRTEATRFVVLLHGAGGSADDGLRLLLRQADEHRLMLFAPQSIGPTWDLIRGGYGPDVARIQQALTQLLTAYRVAQSTLVIGGFSDGASYALSLGLINGDVFDAVVAFSPGFAAPTSQADSPACFISHGTADRVLPIDRCSRRIVPALQRAGYPVRYHEFDGGHEVPPTVVEDAMDWLSTTGAAR